MNKKKRSGKGGRPRKQVLTVNRPGGPELFTFENHEPKGGCVLLSDGTVKFIRTEAELHALRWK